MAKPRRGHQCEQGEDTHRCRTFLQAVGNLISREASDCPGQVCQLHSLERLSVHPPGESSREAEGGRTPGHQSPTRNHF